MEIFNIHLFELLLIAGLALVVFGPERLPELGRLAGKQVARFLAWQQQFPELKVINEVRAEFEQEIANLRDELVRTRRQLDISQEVNLNSLRDELRPMLNLRDEVKGLTSGGLRSPAANPGPAALAPAADPPALAPATDPEPDQTALAPATDPEPDPTATSPAADLALNTTPPSPAGPDAASLAEARLEASADSALAAGNGQATPDAPPQPAGTVQSPLRPNRLAATRPTTVLSQSGPPGGVISEHIPPRTVPNGQRAIADEPAPASDELRLALAQIERLSADLHALVSALHERGLIGADWQPDAAISEQETLSR